MKGKIMGLVFSGAWLLAAAVCLMLVVGTDGAAVGTAGSVAAGSASAEDVAPVSGEEEPDEWSRQIALTFDDGPHPVYTKKLLDGLRERNVKASFFLIGDSVNGNEELVRQMKEDGHLIGNHTSSHVQLSKKSPEEAREEIWRTNEKLKEVLGEEPEYIRPPFGSWSEELENTVPMTVVLWDVDPLDWKVQDKDKVVRHVLKHAGDGEIVLLHDVYETSVDAALEIIDTLSRQGYNFVTAEELLID